MAKELNEIYAFVVERDGVEGILQAGSTGGNGELMIAGTTERLAFLRQHAEAFVHMQGIPVKVIKFGPRQVLEEISLTVQQPPMLNTRETRRNR